MSKAITKVQSYLAKAAAIVGAFMLTVVSAFAQTFDFSSSTAQAGELQAGLIGAATTIALGAIAAFVGFALILMGANYVWGKFKKFTGMKKKI